MTQIDINTYREYAGNLHVHSVYSDGSASHRQIAKEATDAGLDFVIVTDHNVRPEGLERYYGQTLLLVGEEVHNVRRTPQANHLLIYGAEQEMTPYSFGNTQTLIQATRRRNGIPYAAHPIERGSPVKRDLDPIPWVDWPPEGLQGLEIWNYMSEFKGLLWIKPVALIYALWPSWGIKGPYRATLRLWDELLNRGHRLAAIGSADAHGIEASIGPFKRTLFPYSYLFRCVNTHILTRAPLSGDVERDKSLVYEALKAGRTWAGYDLPHPTRGFRYTARSGAAQAVPGEELQRLGATAFTVTLPAPGEIHLLRDGKRILKTRGRSLNYTSVEPGVYRVEVYRRFRLRKVGWVFTSPIYVV